MEGQRQRNKKYIILNKLKVHLLTVVKYVKTTLMTCNTRTFF